MRYSYKNLVGKPEWKRPLGRHKRTWGVNIRMGLKRNGVGSCGLNLSVSEYGPVRGFCQHGSETSDSIKGGKFLH